MGSLHILCSHLDPPELSRKEGPQTEALEVVVAQYRLAVETQMHFNKLILQTRTLGVSAAVVLIGTALLFRSQYPNAPEISIFGLATITPAALMVTFGPGLLLLSYLMDRRYYMALLGGVNRYVYRLESQLESVQIAGVQNAFRQATDIREAFGHIHGASTKYVNMAYLLVLAAEVLVIAILWTSR